MAEIGVVIGGDSEEWSSMVKFGENCRRFEERRWLEKIASSDRRHFSQLKMPQLQSCGKR